MFLKFWNSKDIQEFFSLKFYHAKLSQKGKPSNHTVPAEEDPEHDILCLSPFTSYQGNASLLEFNFPTYLEARKRNI